MATLVSPSDTSPTTTSVIRLAGALLSEQTDEWLVQRLRDRVEALGGTLRVTSPAGRGTALLIQLPVE